MITITMPVWFAWVLTGTAGLYVLNIGLNVYLAYLDRQIKQLKKEMKNDER